MNRVRLLSTLALKTQVPIEYPADDGRRALPKCRCPVKSLASPRRKS